MLHRHKHGGLGVRGRTVAQDAENLDHDGVTEQPVGFQNLAMGGDLGFTRLNYSLMRAPSTWLTAEETLAAGCTAAPLNLVQ
jgi:hypothetical protein